MNYIRNIFKVINFRKGYEALIKKYYGGFFEKPSKNSAYNKTDAINYNNTRENTEAWQKENKTLADFLKNIPNGITVLDVPFGTGRFTNLYRDKQFIIYGLEKSIEMINVAKKNNQNEIHITCGDAIEIPFENNKFDLVVSVRFLPHIISFGNAKKVIAELSRVSKKYVIVQLGERLQQDFRRRLPKDDEKMGCWLYPDEIEEFLKKVGLRIIRKSEALHPGVTMKKKYYWNEGNWYAYLCEKCKD